MGLPPGGNAPGSVSPASAAEGLAGRDGSASIDGTATADRPAVPRARPSTGDPRVDDAVARLDDLAGLPVTEHVAVFEYVHERLTEALGDLDVHAAAGAGDRSPGAPGG